MCHVYHILQVEFIRTVCVCEEREGGEGEKIEVTLAHPTNRLVKIMNSFRASCHECEGGAITNQILDLNSRPTVSVGHTT